MRKYDWREIEEMAASDKAGTRAKAFKVGGRNLTANLLWLGIGDSDPKVRAAAFNSHNSLLDSSMITTGLEDTSSLVKRAATAARDASCHS